MIRNVALATALMAGVAVAQTPPAGYRPVQPPGGAGGTIGANGVDYNKRVLEQQLLSALSDKINALTQLAAAQDQITALEQQVSTLQAAAAKPAVEAPKPAVAKSVLLPPLPSSIRRAGPS